MNASGRRRSSARRRDGSDFDDGADLLDEVVVLLRAGLSLDDACAEADFAERIGSGGGPTVAIVVQAVLEVCRISGAPAAPALARQAEVLRRAAEIARQVVAAAAGPRGTAKVVAALPLAGLVLAILLGFDVVGAVGGSIVGAASTVFGVALTVAGMLWNGRIVRGALPHDGDPGLLHDLTAVALRGGAGQEEALLLAGRVLGTRSEVLGAVPEPGADERRSLLSEAGDDIRRLMHLVRRSGASLGPLLESQAELRRRRRAAASRLRAERLPTALLAPLGVCALPAFLLLGVVPALLAVVSSTVV